ncbi:MAG TPA: exodeoxyribonuclease VII small subunit [Steroidobacteraceae bacterium]|nr:exodeoxyribonuclease VII small subunit [Steroidobacteraceae bacterium]
MARTKSAPPASAVSADTARFDFERAMTELESVVAKLEQGDVPLEEALNAFERGVALTRACQQALAAAEQKVELLMTRSDGVSEAVPFDATAGEDEPG